MTSVQHRLFSPDAIGAEWERLLFFSIGSYCTYDPVIGKPGDSQHEKSAWRIDSLHPESPA